MIKTKVCSGCGETKDLSEFHKSSYSKDKLQYRCKWCNKITAYSKPTSENEILVNTFIPDAAKVADDHIKKTKKRYISLQGKDGRIYQHCFWTQKFHQEMNRLSIAAGYRKGMSVKIIKSIKNSNKCLVK